MPGTPRDQSPKRIVCLNVPGAGKPSILTAELWWRLVRNGSAR